MSRDGLTFYFHLCPGYKIIHSDYVENLNVIQVSKAHNHTKSCFSETAPSSKALRPHTAVPGAVPPRASAGPPLGSVWFGCWPPAGGLSSGYWSCLAQTCRQAEVAGQILREGVRDTERQD